MARVVVEVMPKPEILDPQGTAVRGALGRLGFEGVIGVRQGKRFEIELASPLDDAGLERVREMASTLLANPVIEDFSVRVEASSAEPNRTDPDERPAAQAGAATAEATE